MPLDAEPSDDGNVEIVERDGRSIAIVHGQPTLTPALRWMPHHATCPHWEGSDALS